MEWTVELSRVVDVLSQEAGCPLVVAGSDGRVLARPSRYRVPCFEVVGFCPGAQAFSQHPRPGVVVRRCPQNDKPHLVVYVDLEPRAVVLAELWLAEMPGGVRARARRASRLLAAIVRESLPPLRPEPELPPEEVPSELLRQAIKDGRVTAAGLHRVRTRYHVSWRELEVLVLYYLTVYGPGSRARTVVARTLGITEGTVREYVRRLRRKLRLRWRRSPEILAWARAEGLVGEAVR